ADLVELQAALEQGEQRPRLGGLAEAKGFQAQLSELLGWFPAQGIELKSIAPLLIDFPAEMDGEPVLLCWLEGEHQLAWYHKPEHGFAGRRLIPAGWGERGRSGLLGWRFQRASRAPGAARLALRGRGGLGRLPGRQAGKVDLGLQAAAR